MLYRALMVVVVTGLLSVAAIAQSPSPSRSVRDGVYSAAQADRGNAVYAEKCTNCHAARMWGSDWTEKSLWDLYDTVNNYMPQDNPGSLTPAQSRDVVAYILKTNGLPGGTKELPESTDDLKGIRMELP